MLQETPGGTDFRPHTRSHHITHSTAECRCGAAVRGSGGHTAHGFAVCRVATPHSWCARVSRPRTRALTEGLQVPPANARSTHPMRTVILEAMPPSAPKLSHNHSHSRRSTNIGARNAFSPYAYELSTIHRHTSYANWSPENQIPIIDNPRERRAFWDTIPTRASNTRKLPTAPSTPRFLADSLEPTACSLHLPLLQNPKHPTLARLSMIGG
jgi:hypothetical protein